MWKSEEPLTAPITLTPLDEQTLTKLRHGYEAASDAETRTRYQMLLFSAKGHTSTQIAELVLRSQDTVVRVLKRFLTMLSSGISRSSQDACGRPLCAGDPRVAERGHDAGNHKGSLRRENRLAFGSRIFAAGENVAT